MKTPKDIQAIKQKLFKHGYQSYIVGGALRDMALGLIPKDYDLATNAIPNEVMRIFKNAKATGIAYGTVTIFQGKRSFEITTLRKDFQYKDMRRPAFVEFCNDIHVDLSRRDFTVNAMAYDLVHQVLIDPYQGKKDCQIKTLRTVGSALDRFKEDALRIMRAARLMAGYGFKPTSSLTLAAKKRMVLIKHLSIERISQELHKIHQSKHCLKALDWLKENGFYHKVFGIKDFKMYPYGERYQWLNFILQLKHKDQWIYQNQSMLPFDLKREMVDLSKALKDPLNMDHLSLMAKEIKTYRLKKQWFALCRLHLKHRQCDLVQKAILKILRKKGPIFLCDLKIKGRDVLEVFNEKPGPWVGQVLDEVLAKVRVNPSLNQKSTLIKLIKSII